jgi:hypothetical protein
MSSLLDSSTVKPCNSVEAGVYLHSASLWIAATKTLKLVFNRSASVQAAVSLKQTLTHLFDAVRYDDHSRELEDSARDAEKGLGETQGRLLLLSEEMEEVLSTTKDEKEGVMKDLSQQVMGFFVTAREQARAKLEKGAKQQIEDLGRAAASEKDKALKSLEAFFASDPLPILETVVRVKLSEGIYESNSTYECEGGMRYDFRLTAQNSKLFHEPFSLSKLGYELKVPVRFSKALLSKTRVPGFERLDQYTLEDAEASGEKLRATFAKSDGGAKLKVVTSGGDEEGFVGIDYSDQVQSVNVMNDPGLVAFVDAGAIKKATRDLARELLELSKAKVALVRLNIDGEGSLEGLSYRGILDKVMTVMGPAYRGLVEGLSMGKQEEGGDDLTIAFVQGRLKMLGSEVSGSVSKTLGLKPIHA